MQTISVQELKKRLANGDAIHILDVREPAEYAEFNIGGELLPLGKIMAAQTDDIDDWKDDEIVVHCRSGMRSMQACLMLEQLGFKNTKNLEGGVLAWQANG